MSKYIFLKLAFKPNIIEKIDDSIFKSDEFLTYINPKYVDYICKNLNI